MKLNSKYFDSIRVAPRRERDSRERGGRDRLPECQWKGCNSKAEHKAPKGRGRDGEYFHFCIEHVRTYNATYNYFDGMSDRDVETYIKESATGHRPTWKMGANPEAPGVKSAQARGDSAPHDPHGFMAERAKRRSGAANEQRRQLRPLERKSLAALDLGTDADKVSIKARFKELVKLHHPDANGGDKRSEEKLREIIQAYNYLKQAGMV